MSTAYALPNGPIITTQSTDADLAAAGCQTRDKDIFEGKHTPVYQDDDKSRVDCMDDVQHANAVKIITAAKEWGATETETISALTASIQETTLLNPYNTSVPESEGQTHDDVYSTDYDSVGPYQQRVSIYPIDKAMDVSASTKMFLTGLRRAGDNHLLDGKTVGASVQCVQGSARPDDYQDNVTLAQEFYDDYADVGSGHQDSDADKAQIASAIPAEVGTVCFGG